MLRHEVGQRTEWRLASSAPWLNFSLSGTNREPG